MGPHRPQCLWQDASIRTSSSAGSSGRQIDQLVYEFYGLTERDIQLVKYA